MTAIDVLFHVTDDGGWNRALDNLTGRVDHGGLFISTGKFPASGVAQRYSHMRRRSLDLWRNAMRDRGFTLRRLVPVFFLMDDPVTDGERRVLGRFAALQWKLLTEPIKALKALPRIQSAVATGVALAQYLPEKVSLSLLERTPNLEMLVWARDG